MCTVSQIIFHNSRRSKWISAARSTRVLSPSLQKYSHSEVHSELHNLSGTQMERGLKYVGRWHKLNSRGLLPSHLNKSTSQWRLSLRREWSKQRWSLLNQTVCFRGPSTSKQTGCFILKHQARVKAPSTPGLSVALAHNPHVLGERWLAVSSVAVL